MHQPAVARAFGHRAWSYITVSAASLAFVAVLATLVDAGWPLAEGLAGSAAASLLLLAGGILTDRQRTATRQGSP